MNALGLIASIVGSLVLIASTILGFLFGRRKADADTDSVQVKTALELVGGMREQLGANNAEVEILRHEVARLRRRDRLRDKAWHEHEKWDRDRARDMRDRGLDYPDPPPLDIDEYPDPNGRTRAEDLRGGQRDI